MFSFADIFTPSERNGMVPYALSQTAFMAYVVIGVALLVSPAYLRHLQLASLNAPLSFTGTEVISLLNSARANAGLGALKESSALDAAAADKAADILARQYFAHTAPNGKTPWDFIRGRNYNYSAAGENLAIDFVSAHEAHASLMASPTHRANILNARYTEVGVAVRQGQFEGRPTIVIVQYFGRPRAVAAVPAAKPAAPRIAPKPAPAQNPVAAAPSLPSAPLLPAVPSVLGDAEAPSLRPVAPSADPMRTLGSRFSSLILMGGIMAAAAFMVTRAEHLPLHIAFQAAAVLLLLGYVAMTGAGGVYGGSLTPFSSSTFEIAEVS